MTDRCYIGRASATKAAIAQLTIPLFFCCIFSRPTERVATGHAAGINGFATLSGLFMAYFGARFGVLGVYVSSRSREKQAVATGQPVPGVVEKVVKAVTKR